MNLKWHFIANVLAVASAVGAISVEAAGGERRAAVEQHSASASTPIVQQNYDDRALLDAWESEDGTFSIWGSLPDAAIDITETVADDKAENDSVLSRRGCRPPLVECDQKKNMASLHVCEMLVGSLEGSRGDEWIRKSPRDYCLENDQGRCCVSWRTRITSNVRVSELAATGNVLLRECHDGKGRVSGRVLNAEIGEFCSVQCLSNRPSNHC